MLEDDVGDVLALRHHADGLGADVHGENLRRPNPGRRTPGGLVEEDEQEKQECERNTDGLRLCLDLCATRCVVQLRSSNADGCEAQHTDGHTDATDNEEEFATEAVDGPDSVEREDDSAGAVDGVDEVDGAAVGVDALVDLRRVVVERALAGKLLAGVDDKGDPETLAHRGVLPECTVARRDGFFLEFECFANHEDFVFDFLLGVADAAEGGARFVDLLAVLDVPTRSLGNEGEEDNDDDGDEHLEDDDELPVPVAKHLDVIGETGGVCDPVGNEGSDRVEELPEAHDLATNLRRCELSNIDRTSS